MGVNVLVVGVENTRRQHQPQPLAACSAEWHHTHDWSGPPATVGSFLQSLSVTTTANTPVWFANQGHLASWAGVSCREELSFRTDANLLDRACPRTNSPDSIPHLLKASGSLTLCADKPAKLGLHDPGNRSVACPQALTILVTAAYPQPKALRSGCLVTVDISMQAAVQSKKAKLAKGGSLHALFCGSSSQTRLSKPTSPTKAGLPCSQVLKKQPGAIFSRFLLDARFC
jgi:hypothetical protein